MAIASVRARRIVWCVLALVGSAAIGITFAGDDRAAHDKDVNSARVEALRATGALPALAVAVVRSSGVEWSGVAGARCAHQDPPVLEGDVWHLGSCGKAMTATMIARLVERGALSWDKPIAALLPDLSDDMDEAYRGLTLIDLLSHRAGLGGGNEVPGLWAKAYEMEGTATEQRAAFVRGVLTHAPVAEVGDYHYSNAGYAVAGHIAEVATGKAWESLMREQVFDPLGMTSAGFGVGWRDPAVTAPWGHNAKGRGVHVPVMPGPNADNPPAIGPAGTMHMSIEDWAAFVGAHLRGARAEGGLLLTPETFEKLRTPAFDGGTPYALGWVVTQRPWAKGQGAGDTGRE